MRGKAILRIFAVCIYRITPAHAGKSIQTILSRVRIEDHPRPCGEKPLPARYSQVILGSPPPMRGKELGQLSYDKRIGITPAHAGKRLGALLKNDDIWDHPRPCGEKRISRLITMGQAGSPPPMRGKVVKRVPLILGVGITPAHAGKSGA